MTDGLPRTKPGRPLGNASIRTTFDEYAHLDTRDVLADLAVIEGRA